MNWALEHHFFYAAKGTSAIFIFSFGLKTQT